MSDLFQVVQRLRQEQGCPEIPQANTVPFLTAPSNFGVLANLYLQQELTIPQFEENIARTTKKEQLSALIAYFPGDLAGKIAPYTQGLVDNVESDAVAVFREVFGFSRQQRADEAAMQHDNAGSAENIENIERQMGQLKDENARLTYLVDDQTGEITALNEELLRQLDYIDSLEAETERLQKLTASHEAEIAANRALSNKYNEQIAAYNAQMDTYSLEIKALAGDKALLYDALEQLRRAVSQFRVPGVGEQLAVFDSYTRNIYDRIDGVASALYNTTDYLLYSRAGEAEKRATRTAQLAEAAQAVQSLQRELAAFKATLREDSGAAAKLQRIAELSAGQLEAAYRLSEKYSTLQRELDSQRTSLHALHCMVLEMAAEIIPGGATLEPADCKVYCDVRPEDIPEGDEQRSALLIKQIEQVLQGTRTALAVYKDSVETTRTAHEKAYEDLKEAAYENAALHAKIQELEAEMRAMEDRLRNQAEEAVLAPENAGGEPGELQKAPSEPEMEHYVKNGAENEPDDALKAQISALRELLAALEQQLADVSEAARESELEKPQPSELQAQFNELQGRSAETLIQYARAAAALENAQKDYSALAKREKKPMLMQQAEMLKELAAQTQRNAALSIQVQNLQNQVISLQSAQREVAALRTSYCTCQNALFLHENFQLQARRILGE